MTLLEDLQAAKDKLANDQAALQVAQLAVDSNIAEGVAAKVELSTAAGLVAADQAEVARIEAEIAVGGGEARPWLGVWCHEPDSKTWLAVRQFAPKVTAFRWRGDNMGRFDFAFDSTQAFLEHIAGDGLRVTGNFNLRLGHSPQKRALSLLDVAGGKYDTDIIAAAKILTPFADGDLEIWSECNVQHGPVASQPTPTDWSLPNWEKAFVHVAKLLRANGVTIKLGTSIAGPAQMARWKSWVPPGIVAESDFIGFDFYKRRADANWPSKSVPIALKAAKEMGLPLIICETGVNKGLGLGKPYFGELLAEVKKAPVGAIAGVVCTNGDHPDGPYWLDPPSPDHAAFLAFANDPIWR